MIAFCRKCKDILDQMGDLPSEIYEEICCHYIRNGKSLTMYERSKPYRRYFSIILFLEEKSFVSTTEKGLSGIKIKPLGHYILDDGIHRFCIKDSLKHG